MVLRIALALLFAAGGYLLVALGLIASQRPGSLPEGRALDFAGVTGRGFELPDDERFQRARFAMPDGASLAVTRVADPDLAPLPLVVMVHGSGWHGGQFDRLAWALRDVAEVRAVTLRGHGEKPERRGDVDYIGQLEDDLVPAIGDNPEGRPVILLGHSSGGGLVARFAGGAHGGLLDGAILLAPYLGHNAPTVRENSGGWAHPLVRRIIGLSMLNAVGIHALDHLPVIQFAMPRAVLEGPEGAMATTAYSCRMNVSYAPRRDYLGDVAALPRFMLVAGAEDEAFKAKAFEPTISAVNDRGGYVIVPGVGHLDIVDAPETEAAIREFLRGF